MKTMPCQLEKWQLVIGYCYMRHVASGGFVYRMGAAAQIRWQGSIYNGTGERMHQQALIGWY